MLTEPSEGVPPLVTTPHALHKTVALRGGLGPVAMDEAHGFRYSQRAYLIQLRRAGSGTHLVDPAAFGQPADLSALGAAVSDAEWVIHAAGQDLPCLRGRAGSGLFLTPNSPRLLGYPRVALGTMIEELLGVRLLKEHSASDWSKRPLPEEWLIYAALDVELLIELRHELADRLVEAGKWSWAEQSSRHWLRALASARNRDATRGAARPASITFTPVAVWRTSPSFGTPVMPSRSGWTAHRARFCPTLRSPSWLPTNIRIVPRSGRFRLSLAARPGAEASWLEALDVVAQTPEGALPPMHVPNDGPPQSRLWPAKNPGAAARLAAMRGALLTIAERELPMENLLTPDHLRRLAWRPPPRNRGIRGSGAGRSRHPAVAA